MEFMQLPCVQEASLDEPSTQLINVVSIIRNERLRMKGKWGVSHVSPKSHVPRNESLRSPTVEMQSICQASTPEPVFFSTHGTSGILDAGAGATKSVAFVHRKLASRCPKCEITCKFGNQGALDGKHALVIPLTSIALGLKVAIFEGETPLLLSKTLIRTLRASIDSEGQVLSSPFLQRTVKLHVSSKGL